MTHNLEEDVEFMIRTNLEDFADDEYENILIPYEENFQKYIEKYILPEIVAFGIASGFERNAIWTGSLKQHYNTIKDRIPIFNEDYDSIIKDVKNLLEIKFSLIITKDDPLEIEKIKY